MVVSRKHLFIFAFLGFFVLCPKISFAGKDFVDEKGSESTGLLSGTCSLMKKGCKESCDIVKACFLGSLFAFGLNADKVLNLLWGIKNIIVNGGVLNNEQGIIEAMYSFVMYHTLDYELKILLSSYLKTFTLSSAGIYILFKVLDKISEQKNNTIKKVA